MKVFVSRKRQELQQMIDNTYSTVDVVRQTVEIKSFIKDLDIESTNLIEVKDLLLVLIDKKYDSQVIRLLEKKQEDASHDVQRLNSISKIYCFYKFLFYYISLKNDAVKAIENLDNQAQEQDKLRQHARTILSLIQRTKVLLIELHPTMSDEATQRLKVCSSDFLLQSNDEFFFRKLTMT